MISFVEFPARDVGLKFIGIPAGRSNVPLVIYIVKLYIFFKLLLSILEGLIYHLFILRKKEGLYGDVKDVATATNSVSFGIKLSSNSSLFKL